MFLFKKRKIYLDCFTQHGIVAQDNPIQKASNFIPDWWKKLPKGYQHKTELGVDIFKPTMKGCLGFIDLYRSGLIVPLWSDLNFKVQNGQFYYQFAHNDGVIGHHNSEQHLGGLKNLLHFKIISPWFFKETRGINFFVTSCIWSSLDHMPKLHILNGVVNFKINQACNINGFASLENQPYQYNLEAGMPLVQIIPLSEEDVIPVIHTVSEAEWMKISRNTTPYKFLNWGITRKKLLSKKESNK
jgi:hypothetical protein